MCFVQNEFKLKVMSVLNLVLFGEGGLSQVQDLFLFR